MKPRFDKMVKQNIKVSVFTMRPTYKNPKYEAGINRERENRLVCLTFVQQSG